MAYIKPSVLVYQELENAGGVANVTPDLGAVIVGPLFNVVRVDPLSPTSMATTITKTVTDIVSDTVVVTGDDYIEIPLYNPYPGQIVRTDSVSVHISEARVLAYSFEHNVGMDSSHQATDFNNGLRTRYKLSNTSTIPPVYAIAAAHPVGDPLLKMPDDIGVHIEKGYEVEITYDDPDITGTGTVTITGTVIKTSLTSNGLLDYVYTSVPVPTFTSTSAVIATVRVYKVYTYFLKPSLDSDVVFTDVDNDKLRITVTNTNGVNGIRAFAAVTGTNPTADDDYLITQGNFSISYKALRQDKYSTIMTISDTAERLGMLGEDTEENPLALGVQICLENTTKQVFAVSLQEEGGEYLWSVALELLENFRAGYALVPLTQDEAVISSFKTHVQQLSTPELASWRVVICNTKIPTTKDIVARATLTNTTGTGKVVGTNKYMQDLTESFISKQVTPGDLLVVTASNLADAIGTWVVDDVINENVLAIQGFNAISLVNTTTLTYHIVRNLTRRQRAEEVAAKSTTFGSNRVWHIQPDSVGVNVQGTIKFLPGYYLCAAVAGLTSGFPVQQGFTNISVAGLNDLNNSNFYFRREELNLMAAAGTCLFVQETQGGIPYCRHALTTDMTVLEYREQLKVKNWDFLSFYYYDKLKGFIGTWNITPDTLSNMRQVINASSEMLKGQKLPKIGPPLMSAVIQKLAQNEFNKDNIDIRLKIEIVSPNNYTNLYLVI